MLSFLRPIPKTCYHFVAPTRQVGASWSKPVGCWFFDSNSLRFFAIIFNFVFCSTGNFPISAKSPICPKNVKTGDNLMVVIARFYGKTGFWRIFTKPPTPPRLSYPPLRQNDLLAVDPQKAHFGQSGDCVHGHCWPFSPLSLIGAEKPFRRKDLHKLRF